MGNKYYQTLEKPLYNDVMRSIFWLGFFMLVLTPLALAADPSPLWTSYAQLLKGVAAEDGVRWAQFDAARKEQLSELILKLKSESAGTQKTPHDQLAFWINAHNLCVMKFILDRMPLDDAMKIEGFRDRLKCSIGGTEYSLMELESQVIRPLYEEPRVHFALWWGTKGGPRLLSEPYRGEALEDQLSSQTKRSLEQPEFLSIPEGVSEASRVRLSPLFDWYRNDFGKGKDDVLTFLKRNLPKKRQTLLPSRMSSVEFQNFDWALDRSKE